jgi:hypothetical protein
MEDTFNLRFAVAGPQSYNEETQSVRVTAVTSNRVRIWDAERPGLIDEVLVLAGARIPPSGQVPLLDAHNRKSVSGVLGSARNFRREGKRIDCDVFFSGTPAGREAAQMVKEGHLTDFSVGYTVDESTWVPEGQTREIHGDMYAGPVRVTTRWYLRELSATPVGADESAKARSSTDLELRKLLLIRELQELEKRTGQDTTEGETGIPVRDAGSEAGGFVKVEPIEEPAADFVAEAPAAESPGATPRAAAGSPPDTAGSRGILNATDIIIILGVILLAALFFGM